MSTDGVDFVAAWRRVTEYLDQGDEDAAIELARACVKAGQAGMARDVLYRLYPILVKHGYLTYKPPYVMEKSLKELTKLKK